MAIYNGVMAGIGDIENDVNVIDPQFDAKVNNFIVGADGILLGMELNGSVLSSGICIAKGYRGSIDTDITLDTTNYVYGVFSVYHSPDMLDEFSIVTSSTPLGNAGGQSFGDDILHEAGTYYLRLNASNSRLNYPINAYNADNTDKINKNGTIGDGTTAVTQPVNDNSTKIATTAYVHNQIEEEINYTPLNYNQSKSYNFNDAFGATAVLTFNFNFQGKKKAKLCVIDRIDFSITHTGVDFVDTSISANTVLATLPEDFKPINNVVIVPQEYFSSNNTAIGFGIDTNGNVYNIDAMNSPRETYPDKVWYNVGYETQV